MVEPQIINFYVQLIFSSAKGKAKAVKEKYSLDIRCFSTSFWPKLTGEGYDKGGLGEWVKFDLFSKDVILVPVNHDNSYWTAAAISFRKKRIELYGRMGVPRSAVHKVLREYLDDEHRNKKTMPFDFTGWVDFTDETTPQQENGCDSGVFMCQFLRTLSQGEEDDFGFSQVDIPYLRRKMIWEIGNAKLRDEP